MVTMDLSGQVAIVTGGYGAIGGEIATGLVEAGCFVIVLGRSRKRLDAKVDALGGEEKAVGIECDVVDTSRLEEVNQQILSEYGKINILINAAGGTIPGSTQTPDQNIFDIEIEDIQKVIDLNLHGSIYPSLLFGPSLAKHGGSIINISSMSTYQAITRVMGYSVGKTGINSFTQWMACEMARKFDGKVRVNAIAPGFFIGEQNRRLLTNEDGSYTERGQAVINGTPMGRFGELKECVGLVQFLCTEAASFITGTVIPIDGGFSSYSGV
jgi:NAD(P)-dependent dehydrogenase (short-subunit alcohol dehydrogenase family)